MKRFVSLILILSIVLSCFCIVDAKASYKTMDGTYMAKESMTSGADCLVHYYYSDGLFDDEASSFNQQLATMSMNLAVAAMNNDGSDNAPFSPEQVRRILVDIGFSRSKMFSNSVCYEGIPSTDDPAKMNIAFTAAGKALEYADGSKTGYMLVPVVISGASDGKEALVDDFLIKAEDSESSGFAGIADNVFKELEDFIANDSELSKALQQGKLKFWVTGNARGGSAANLLAKRLIEKYGTESVYAYTFNAALVGDAKTASDSKYDSIFNIVNRGDALTYFAPASMGFARYGKDISIVESQGKSDYEAESSAMKAQLALIAPKNTSSDSFVPASLDLGSITSVIQSGSLAGKIDINTFLQAVSGFDSDKNDYELASEFMSMAFDAVLSGAGITKDAYTSESLPWKTKDGKYYTMPAILPSLHIIARNVLGTNADSKDLFLSRAKDILNVQDLSLKEKLDLLSDLSTLTSWGSQKPSSKYNFVDKYWEKIVATGAVDSDVIKPQQLEEVKSAVFRLLDIVFSVISLDNSKASEYAGGSVFKDVSAQFFISGTALVNMSTLFSCHDYLVNLAWLRAHDNLYAKEGSWKGSDAGDLEYSMSVNGNKLLLRQLSGRSYTNDPMLVLASYCDGQMKSFKNLDMQDLSSQGTNIFKDGIELDLPSVSYDKNCDYYLFLTDMDGIPVSDSIQIYKAVDK